MKITRSFLVICGLLSVFAFLCVGCREKAEVGEGEPSAPEVVVGGVPEVPEEEEVPAPEVEKVTMSFHVLLRDDSVRSLEWPVADRPQPSPLNARIKVSFSQDVADKAEAQAKFNFIKFQLGDVPGEFTWPDERTMIFAPQRLLVHWSIYEVWYNGEQKGIVMTPVPFDVNGDGISDLALPAAMNQRVYLILGRAELASLDLSSWSGPKFVGGPQLGLISSIAGDLNADGYWDLVLRDGNDRLAIFFGRDSFEGEIQNSSADVRIAFNDTIKALAVRDIDQDGYADLAVSEEVSPLPPLSNLYLIAGESLTGGIVHADLIRGEGSQNNFPALGNALAFGDVNADGYPDLMVTSLLMGSGQVTVLYGPDFQNSDILSTPAMFDSFGYSLTTADLDGDVDEEIIVGAPKTNSERGMIYVYFGDKYWTTNPPQVLDGPTAGEFFGASVASIGDVDGDGHDDVAVGSPQFQDNQTQYGKVSRIYYDGSQLQMVELGAKVAPGNLGAYVAAAGNLSAVNDLNFIGVSTDAESFKGMVMIFTGGQSSTSQNITGDVNDGLGAGVKGEFPMWRVFIP